MRRIFTTFKHLIIHQCPHSVFKKLIYFFIIRFDNNNNIKNNCIHMTIRLKNQDNGDELKGTWCYDIVGNVYININEKFYVSEINKNNDIEFNLIDNDVFYTVAHDARIKYNSLIETGIHSLKRRVLDEIENNEDSDQDEHYQNYQERNKHLKEDKYFVADNHSPDEESDSEYDDCQFYRKGDDDCIHLLDKGLETPAIYDFYVRDSTKNVLLMCTSKDSNCYRISIFLKDNNNYIELNIIGSEIKQYVLVYKENNIIASQI